MGIFSWLFGKKKKKRKKRPASGKRPLPAGQRPKGSPPAGAKPAAEAPKAVPPPPAGYFEVPLPDGDGVCSDEECMCGGALIARGSGYLYVDRETVDFRSNAPTVEQAQAKEARVRSQMGGMDEAAAVMHGRTTAMLICEQSARRRGIDLEVAAADAGHWWETGQSPLRATPEAKPVEAKPAKEAADPVADKPAAGKPKAKKKAKPKSKTTETKAKKTAPKAKKSTKSAAKKKDEEGEVEAQG
jgi:hypothetical protein